MSGMAERMQDDDYIPPVWLCGTCQRKRPGSACDAFPRGIPREIRNGSVTHTQPYPGDGGLQYVERKNR